jgi:peptidoglycan/LPS O-acetylase OafA/YrhL
MEANSGRQSATDMNQNQERLDALTGLRGIAAWWVVFFHIGPAFEWAIPAGIATFWGWGFLAVDLFFILSGFVMWLTYADRFQDLGWRYSREFLARRLARIYPLHVAVMLFALWFVFLWWATGRGVPGQYPLAELPLHFLLIQNWGFTDRLTWNDPAWSISTELAAYLLLAAVGPIIARWRPALGTLFLVMLGAIALFATALTWPGSLQFNTDIPHWGLSRCLIEFFSGILLCMIWQRRSATAGSSMLWGSIALALLAIPCWLGTIWWQTASVPLFCAALIMMLAITSNARRNPLSSGIAVHLGDISYSVYLTHFLIWVYLKVLIIRTDYHAPLFYLVLMPVLVYGASLMSYRYIELPGRRALHRYLTR